MRIQHNILAMNAYRNYNTNTSALAKNLEKLSSGYKINRAGDDAAGLAISEKMRAQITGLNAAQKNVKDGISLVKTAEGAMQEIQDMLNRMDYLATQSANGTYQDEVDRENLNKEMTALKTEIDRIAESANFNGIKLLDGSRDANNLAVEEVKESQTVNPSETEALTVANGKLPEVGQILGENTVLHVEKGTVPDKASMSIDLHNLEVSGVKGQEFTIQVGDTKLTGTLQSDFSSTALTSNDIADALGNGTDTKVKFTYEDGTAYDKDNVKFGDGEFTASVSGTRVSFVQTNAEDVEFDPEMEVTVSTAGSTKATEVATATTTAGQDITGKTKASYISNSAIAKVNLTEAQANNKYNVDLGDLGTIEVTFAAGEDEDDLIDKAISAYATANAGIGVTAAAKDGTDDIKITFTATSGDAAAAAAVVASLGLTGTAVENGTTGSWDLVLSNAYADAQGRDLADSGTANKYDVAIDGSTQTLTGVTLASDEADVGQAWVDEYNKTGGTGDTDLAEASYDAASKKINLVADVAGDSSGDVSGTPGTQTTSSLGSLSGGVGVVGTNNPATKAETVIDFTGKTGADVLNGTIQIGNGATVYEFVLKDGDQSNGNTAVVITEKDKAEDLAQKLQAAAAAAAPTGVDAPAATNNAKVIFQATTAGAAESGKVAATIGKAGGDPKVSGDYNKSTTVIEKKGDPIGERLASTYFDLTKDMAANGSVLTIGKTDYTFTTDKADKAFVNATGNTDNKVYVGDLDLSTEEGMIEAADRLTKVAEGNTTYTVGHDGSRMTFTENKGQTDFVDANGLSSLTELENVEKSFGFKGVSYQKEVVTTEAKEGGKALNLQIGDTSDEWNQMKVSIGDMHVTAMGTFDKDGKLEKSIDEVDILNPENAAEAVEVIKNAINYVSSVRGDLGAYQNRLEHTANNLSVMAENIQDAESTIRDTDIAEEMMAYTKNNILVQSAQAMLAQANAVPQGVLQLLG